LPHTVHIPVLPDEVVGLLNPQPGKTYIDGTLGGGGHCEAILRRSLQHSPEQAGNITVIGIDKDVHAVDRAEQYLKNVFSDTIGKNVRIRFVHADYRHFEEALDMLGIGKVDGFLLDLGLSSDQLADRQRGFSFDSDGTLDLRFDTSEGVTASELLAKLPEDEIAGLIYRYGEERCSRRIARQIVQRRANGQPVRQARELAEIVRACVPKIWKTNKKGTRSPNIDPATRTFQALRIAVNDELSALENTLKALPGRMNPGGVVAVISFHSLEDRIVKHVFKQGDYWEIITKKPVVADEKEIERNPRSRSAKLRGARYVKTG
jgi:16S rRNA (cytosine1402-N4)-methyltransferase